MQVDVDRFAVFLCQPKDGVELSLWVAVDATGVQPADNIGPIAQRLIHQLDRTGADHYARLRKGYDFDLHHVGKAGAGFGHALEHLQPVVGVDVHVAADGGRPLGQRQRDLPRGLAGGVHVQLVAQAAFGVDHLLQAFALGVRMPGHTPQRLVPVSYTHLTLPTIYPV